MEHATLIQYKRVFNQFLKMCMYDQDRDLFKRIFNEVRYSKFLDNLDQEINRKE